MPRSTRGGGRHSTPLLPLALTLGTAALASAGLYFFSDFSREGKSAYPGSDSEPEAATASSRSRRGRGGRRSARSRFEHDRITEEDTDAIEESRREEEEMFSRRRATTPGGNGNVLTYMKGAAVGALGSVTGEEEELKRRRELEVKSEAQQAARSSEPVPIPFPPTSAPPATSTTTTSQYVPSVPRRRPIAIVLNERKALQGHDSDEEFEEALLPARSLLSRLPRPLNLPNSTLYILIHSPHLSSHPLSPEAKPKKPSKPSTLGADLTTRDAAPSPMPSPSLAPTKHLLEDSQKSTWELATDLLSRVDLPRENILPFQAVDSLVPMLRHLEPTVVYIEEQVLGDDERVVREMLNGGGLGTVVVVIGGDDEIAGLMSESEGERKERSKGKWWEEGSAIRRQFGRRLEVVEAWVVEEDWRRRVEDS